MCDQVYSLASYRASSLSVSHSLYLSLSVASCRSLVLGSRLLCTSCSGATTTRQKVHLPGADARAATCRMPQIPLTRAHRSISPYRFAHDADRSGNEYSTIFISFDALSRAANVRRVLANVLSQSRAAIELILSSKSQNSKL